MLHSVKGYGSRYGLEPYSPGSTPGTLTLKRGKIIDNRFMRRYTARGAEQIVNLLSFYGSVCSTHTLRTMEDATSEKLTSSNGPVVHLAERLICNEEAGGSSPLRSTGYGLNNQITPMSCLV